MAFRLEIWDDVSIAGLLCGARERRWALHRSSHLGNQYPSNLLLLEAGVPAVLFDRNVAGKDRNYRPESLVVGGRDHRIAQHDAGPFGERTWRIAPFLEWNGNRDVAEQFVAAPSPAALHFRSLRLLYPDRVELESEFLLRHRALLEPVFAAVARWLPREFDRQVDAHGRVTPRSACWPSPLPASVFETCRVILDRLEGKEVPRLPLLLHSNPLAMYVMAYAAARSAGVDTLVDCSGPDMVQYVRTLEPRLQAIHNAVGMVLGPQEDLRLAIVPTASLVFTAPGRHAVLEEFLDAWHRRAALASMKRERLGTGTEDVRTVYADHRHCQNVLYTTMRRLAPACGVGYRLRRSGYWTQYDLLRDAVRPLLHPLMLEQPVREIRRIGQKLRLVT